MLVPIRLITLLFWGFGGKLIFYPSEPITYSWLFFQPSTKGLNQAILEPTLVSLKTFQDVSSKEILENEISTSFASGTKVATCTIKRRFLRRRLLYFPNGTESFNPVMTQIILSGDVHPQPGPNSKQKQNSRPGQDPKQNHLTASVVGQHANSCIKIAHLNIRLLKSREHLLLLQDTIEEHDFDIFTISEIWLDSTVDNQVVQIKVNKHLLNSINFARGSCCVSIKNDDFLYF